ncbi:FtsX-like permease family protein [Streptosporangium sandarakinum]|uniref:FtsX-like permease family protein n=1 Tax=Streptosporangium sandarakinum TaxID=1260955 RepID=UPI00342D0160
MSAPAPVMTRTGTAGAARSRPAAFLAALRISRRDALRARGRSALIVTMVGLPVLVIVFALIFTATADITEREGLRARIGTADLRIVTLGRPDTDARASTPTSSSEIMSLLGPGARIIPANDGSVDFRGERGYDHVSAHELDLRDPLTKGMYRLLRGRLPAAPGEIVVTPGAEERGARFGTTPAVTFKLTPMRVVGVVEHPHQTKSAEIIGLPGTLLFDRADGRGTGWLADTPKPVTMADVRRLSRASLGVRAPVEARDAYGYHDTEDAVAIALIVVMGVLEVTLLAGPAFAVGARRRRRELALVAAQGGAPGQVRMVLLADGVVLGGGAALLGLALGVGLGALSAALEAGRLIGAVGPLDIPWVPVLAVAALGAASGVAAAVLPAVRAARQDVAAVLAGRRGPARDRAGRPIIGAVLVVAGAVAAVRAIGSDRVWVLAAEVLALLGLVALTPSMVRLAAAAAKALPLPLRLAARDAARNRGRTASAVAAVMTAAAAFTMAAVAFDSNLAERREAFHPAVPAGTVQIDGAGLDDARWAGVRTLVERALPGAPLIEAVAPRDTRGSAVELSVGQLGAPDGMYPGNPFGVSLPVGDGRLLEFVQGRRDPVAAAAFAAGRAVVFDPDLVRDGRLWLTALHRMSDWSGTSEELSIPAVVARAADPLHAVAVLPASALPALGLKPEARVLYAVPSSVRLTEEQEARLERELAITIGPVGVTFVRDIDSYGFVKPLLFLAAAVLALGGTLAATGLAAVDLRPDLSTMAAVGAKPGTRRLVVAGQAGFVAGLGALAGALAGIPAGIAVAGSSRPYGYRAWAPDSSSFLDRLPAIELPWLFLAALVVGLPLLAALVAGAFTRARVTLTRRVT